MQFQIPHGEAVVLASDYESTSAPVRILLQANASIAYRRQLRSGVEKALADGERRVVVDCSTWSEFDLILLSALMDCAKACDEQGAAFELENLGRDLRLRIGALRLGDRLGLRD